MRPKRSKKAAKKGQGAPKMRKRAPKESPRDPPRDPKASKSVSGRLGNGLCDASIPDLAGERKASFESDGFMIRDAKES